MNLVEDFDSLRAGGYSEYTERFGGTAADEVVVIEPSSTAAIPSDVPLLSVDTTLRQASRLASRMGTQAG